VVDVVDALERGRELYSSRAWLAAYESLAVADQGTPLGAQDLELLATSAYMVGREEDYLRALERGHQAHLGSGEAMRAAQCAIWLAIQLFAAGEIGQASGWLGRARRLVEREGRECVERGYLLLPIMFEHEARGDIGAAIATAAAAAEIGERFADPDLPALARMDQGIFLVTQGRVVEGDHR
jgi:Flp pilus assembly protein TadD